MPRNLLHVDTKKLAKFDQPGHAMPGDRTRHSHRAGWKLCTPSWVTAAVWPTQRSTTTSRPPPRPPLWPCAGVLLRAWHRRRAVDDR